jgi:hypothetical protein
MHAKGFGADKNPVVKMLSSTMSFFPLGVRISNAHRKHAITMLAELRAI